MAANVSQFPPLKGPHTEPCFPVCCIMVHGTSSKSFSIRNGITVPVMDAGRLVNGMPRTCTTVVRTLSRNAYRAHRLGAQ